MPDSFLAVAIILRFPELNVESVRCFFALGFISFRIFVGSFFLVQLHCCEFLLECEFHLKSPSYGFGAAPMDGFPGIHPSLLLLLGPVRGVHYNQKDFFHKEIDRLLSETLVTVFTFAVYTYRVYNVLTVLLFISLFLTYLF